MSLIPFRPFVMLDKTLTNQPLYGHRKPQQLTKAKWLQPHTGTVIEAKPPQFDEWSNPVVSEENRHSTGASIMGPYGAEILVLG